MDPQPVASCLDQARPAQVREVARGFGLWNAQALVNVTDTPHPSGAIRGFGDGFYSASALKQRLEFSQWLHIYPP